MRARTNLLLDLAIAAAFLAAANPPLTGLTIHEWLGLAFAGTLIAHLVLHWEWGIAATTRLWKGGSGGVRLNYVVDALLFVALIAEMLSGLLISKHVLPTLGLRPQAAHGWRAIHSMAADATIAALGVHLGLHWKWLALNVPRLLPSRRRKAGDGRAVESSAGAASCPYTLS